MNENRRLWAPWRIGFIVGPRDEGCFLCRLPSEQRDRENYVLERGQRCFVCLNRYPYNNGHLLISPYRHVGDLRQLDPEELTELMVMAQRWMGHLEGMNPGGFNLGMNLGSAAGAGVADHLHMHLVPRWGGDNNFMSVVADTRLINESLAECYDRLSEAAGTPS